MAPFHHSIDKKYCFSLLRSVFHHVSVFQYSVFEFGTGVMSKNTDTTDNHNVSYLQGWWHRFIILWTKIPFFVTPVSFLSCQCFSVQCFRIWYRCKVEHTDTTDNHNVSYLQGWWHCFIILSTKKYCLSLLRSVFFHVNVFQYSVFEFGTGVKSKTLNVSYL